MKGFICVAIFILSGAIMTTDALPMQAAKDEGLTNRLINLLQRYIQGPEKDNNEDIEKKYFTRSAQLWGNPVPYKIADKKNGDKNPMNDDGKKAVKKAIRFLEKETCLRFVPATDRRQYLYFNTPPDGMSCSADIGKMPYGVTNINLISGCESLKAVLHEVNHGLGRNHEQTNSNRGRDIMMNWPLIDKSSRNMYRPIETTDEYDLHSDMHYPLFDKKGLIMIPFDYRLAYLVGDMEWSFLDGYKLNKAYKCIDSCSSVSCGNAGYATTTKDNPTCHCKCPKLLTGNRCEEIDATQTTGCHKVYSLTENVKVIVESPKDKSKPTTYKKGQKCTYLFKGTKGTRIKLTIKKLQLQRSFSEGLLDCKDHHIGVTLDRIFNPVKKYCEYIPRPGKQEEVLIKSNSKESNLMILTFDSTYEKGGLNSDGAGFIIEAIAQKTDCGTMKCRYPGVCEYSEEKQASVCKCSEGYSGPLCNKVASDSVVTSSFERFKDVSFFKEDTSISTQYGFKETAGIEQSSETDVIYPPAGSYIFTHVTTVNNKQFEEPVEYAQLVTDIFFEEAERCLTFKYFILKAEKDNEAAKFVLYSSSGKNLKEIWKSDPNANVWTTKQIEIEKTKNLKLVLRGHAGTGMYGDNGIDEFVLRPGKCSGPCVPNPCQNSGRCYVSGNGYRCSCPYGFTGTNCEFVPCPEGFCKNNGRCAVVNGRSKCMCTSTHKGDRCETPVCSICKHASVCSSIGADYVPQAKCVGCTPGWTGKFCDEPICKPGICNKGKCVFDSKSYSCSCNTENYGKHCEKSACIPNPCKNGGACKANNADYTCSCTPPYSGKQCEKGVCDPNPCKNEGTCTPSGSTYACKCNPGYTGKNCETVDLCNPNPCENGGSCTSGAKQYTCKCVAPYKGDQCNIGPCFDSPCQNDGTCSVSKTSPSGYTCKCEQGYSGAKCEKDENNNESDVGEEVNWDDVL